MSEIVINKEPVELYKVLKFEGIASSGAVAKHMVASGLVKVNGVVEIQKRKKLMAQDVLEVDGESYQLKLG